MPILILFLIIFDSSSVPKYSTDKVTQFKVREKQAEVPHMFKISLVKMQMRV
jgi:hypothetical protein